MIPISAFRGPRPDARFGRLESWGRDYNTERPHSAILQSPLSQATSPPFDDSTAREGGKFPG